MRANFFGTFKSIDDILDEALGRTMSGGMTISEALASYPEHAATLAPLLRAAQRMRAAPQVSLSMQARRRIQHRVVEPRRQPAPAAHWLRSLWSQPAPRWVTAALSLMLVLTILSTGTATAAASLPGEPLYTAKGTLENARLLVTPESGRPATHLAFAQQRLHEIQTLSILGIPDGVAPRMLVGEMGLAIEGASYLPYEERIELLAQLAQFAQQERTVLARLLHDAPPAQRGSLAWALSMAESHQQEINNLSSHPSLP